VTAPHPTPNSAAGSVREAKRTETRETIRQAAVALFAEHGFDHVTVTDITRASGVARSTFFRYFPDKAEVLFEDDSASHLLLAKAVAGAARASEEALGDSFGAVMRVARAAILVLADSKAIQAVRYPVREQLIAETPQLQACSLVKERGYTDALDAALVEQGAAPLVARQAAHVATACYDAGYTQAFSSPETLPVAVAAAFERLFAL
jgi:AcrR family transcriptional regulator